MPGSCSGLEAHLWTVRSFRQFEKSGQDHFAINAIARVCLSAATTNSNYCDLPQCYVGWTSRKNSNSGEIYEPATVLDKLDLASDSRISIPMVIDFEVIASECLAQVHYCSIENTCPKRESASEWFDLALDNVSAFGQRRARSCADEPLVARSCMDGS